MLDIIVLDGAFLVRIFPWELNIKSLFWNTVHIYTISCPAKIWTRIFPKSIRISNNNRFFLTNFSYIKD